MGTNDENLVRLRGRVYKPVVREGARGSLVASFRLAVESAGYKERRVGVGFFTVEAFRGLAAKVRELKRGALVEVEGVLRDESWRGRDGVRRSSVAVLANRLQVVSGAGSREASENMASAEVEEMEGVWDEESLEIDYWVTREIGVGGGEE